MAPEFFPFIFCAALGLGTLVFGAVTAILFLSGKVRRRSWPLPLVTLSGTVVLAISASFCARGLYGAFWLNEPMATAACQGKVAVVRELLDQGASPNACGVDCAETALVCAAPSRDKEGSD